jgi:hypothetical protein
MDRLSFVKSIGPPWAGGAGLRGKVFLVLFIIIATMNLGNATPTVHAQGNTLPQGGPMRTQAFILLAPEHSNRLDMARLQGVIEANGGRVRHTFPYRAIIVEVPAGTVQQLSALPGVASVFTGAVELSMMDVYGSDARRFASVWNSLISPQSTDREMDVSALDHPDEHDDAFMAPDLPPVYRSPLGREGRPTGKGDLGVASSSSATPGYYQTSEYMTGSVAVGIVLVESDGSVDSSTEDWTDDEKQLVFSEIVAALNWWAEREPRANLSFVYDDHFSNPLPTGVEPITRRYSDQQYWIADAMGTLGYSASSYFTRVRDYNNDLRATYQTDWAFTIFVVDSSVDSDNHFSDGYFAYAYLGGPFTVMTYGNDGYGPHNMDAVAAHEIGHIFLALDQYYSAYQPCTRRSGYLGVENQNSQYGSCVSNVSSIMRGQTWPYQAGAIDEYARGQLGWRDTDGDDILDPLDTELPVSTTTVSQDGDSVTINGAANIVPYPSPSRASVTINTLTNVRYRLDAGDWRPATADDGAFDTTQETYHFTVTSLSPGLHILEVAALDSAGNASEDYATESIAILDPIDGGLNTELRPPAGAVSASATSTIGGVAYHLQNNIVTQVEYRVDGGPWQQASAEDGAFNSDYEPFTLAIDTESLEPGTHLVEARAIDAMGNVEVNYASLEIEIAESLTVFLPLVIR